jgi:hypothetical protein
MGGGDNVEILYLIFLLAFTQFLLHAGKFDTNKININIQQLYARPSIHVNCNRGVERESALEP